MSYYMKYRWVIYWFFVYYEPANTGKFVKIYSDITKTRIYFIYAPPGEKIVIKHLIDWIIVMKNSSCSVQEKTW